MKVGLPHPHLVFELCKEARVQWVEGEELLHPNGAIDNKTFDVYKNYADSSTGDSEVGCNIRKFLNDCTTIEFDDLEG